MRDKFKISRALFTFVFKGFELPFDFMILMDLFVYVIMMMELHLNLIVKYMMFSVPNKQLDID